VTPAPYHEAVATGGPPGGHAVWLKAADGVRLRLGVWPVGARGTVMMFPGRTECVEKYARPAAEFAAMGYASVALDWRGQGLADRPLADPMVGHVARFADYQHDVRAALAAMQALGLPVPVYLVAHSMGGCIGLRSLVEGLPVKAAAFTGPMWGIPPNPALAPVARALAGGARLIGRGTAYAPGTGPATYLATAAFDGNNLTTDRDMWDWMQAQVVKFPALALGGPSLHWVAEAMAEGRWLARRPLPDLPALIAIGSRERIVSPAAIRRIAARWRSARVLDVAGAEHEVLMESRERRSTVYSAISALFAA
jgi:lysophospholipase